jgi:hypothetical protein
MVSIARFQMRWGGIALRRRGLGLVLLEIAALLVACANGGDGAAGSATDLTDDGGAAADVVSAQDASLEATASEAGYDAAARDAVGSDAGGDVSSDDGVDALASPEGGAGADGADGGCPAGQLLCGSTCVDPATDPTHCGGCNTVCSSGICGASLAADMTAQPANWTFNGVALWDSAGPSARLTTVNTDLVAGSVIYNHPIVTDSFEAAFQFRMGAGGGEPFDGMGFLLEVGGPTALGGVGGGLGMQGLDGFGVELDIYDNGKCGDSNGNHVGIDQLTSCNSGQPTSLFATPDLTGTVTLNDGQWHAATVSLVAGGTMSVTVDTHGVVGGVALTGFASGTSYYYGFAGGIGGGSGDKGQQTEVKDVTVTFPSPRCL